MSEEMSLKQKLEVLEQRIPEFKEMMNSFMNSKEDEGNLIFLVAYNCSQNLEILGPCFYLILQLLYKIEIIHDEAILEWIESATKKIEESKNNATGSQSATEAEEAKKDTGAAAEDEYGSFYGSEDHEGAVGAASMMPIPIETMEKFVVGC